MFAETNRLPFDLPESETELVAGYHTEYQLDEVRPVLPRRIRRDDRRLRPDRDAVPRRLASAHSDRRRIGISTEPARRPRSGWACFNIAVFFAKVVALLIFFIWVRWTLPRFRYDQLMRLGWLYFFEIALANIFLTAAHPAVLHAI